MKNGKCLLFFFFSKNVLNIQYIYYLTGKSQIDIISLKKFSLTMLLTEATTNKLPKSKLTSHVITKLSGSEPIPCTLEGFSSGSKNKVFTCEQE